MDTSYWSEQRRLTRRALLRRAGLLTGAAAASPLILACSPGSKRSGTASTSASATPVRGGTLIVRIAAEVSNLDYAYRTDAYSGFVIGNCVETLVTLNPQAQPVGLLAASWENPDPQTYIFKLRPGVTFQDGTPLNADAVEYSLNRVRNDKTAFTYTDLTAVSKIEKPDPATVKISLNAPFAPFLIKLTSGSTGSVISQAAAEKLGKDKLKTDLTGQGSGPFTFVEWKKDDHTTLARNPNYWGKDGTGGALPYFDRITVRAITDQNIALDSLKNAEIDAFRPNSNESPPPKDTANVQADQSLSLTTAPGIGYSYIVFNEAKEPFNNKLLRQAVSYAIDRDSIAKNVYFGTVVPLDVIFASSIWATDPNYHPYLKRDVAKAKQLLAQAGKPNGFAFTYNMQSGNPVSQQLAELIKDQLNDAGIQMTIQPLEFAALTQALTAGQHQAGSLGWSASYDPDDWVYSHFSSKGSLNVRSHYSNPDVDRLLDQARTELDPAKRKPLYQQAQKQFIDDAVFAVLYLNNNWSLSTAKVKNYPIGPTPAVGVSQVWKTS
jgi:peptide/nickel transport system substrate-binding protein